MLARKMIIVMVVVVLAGVSAAIVRHVWASAVGGEDLLMKAESSTAFGGGKLDGENEGEQPEYVADEIIVKFKRVVADALEEQLARGKGVGALRLSGSLDRLNNKYGVRKVAPLIKNFKGGRARIENLLKKDTKLLTKREKHLVRRLKRAPKGVKVPELDRIYKMELEEGQSAADAAAEYSRDPDVQYAELDYMVSIVSTEPNDPCYPVQWALRNVGQSYPKGGGGTASGTADCDIGANEAWDLSTGSSDVIVAVIDTGVDYTHRDLQGNMWTGSDGSYGYDFVDDDNDPMDDQGHGTHCAGIISADTNNGYDVAGVSWNAKIMALKFLCKYGWGWTSDAVLCFYYATDDGADVTSNSWGGGAYSESLEDAIDYAHSQGVITVAAAGNDGIGVPFLPADYNHVVSVAATDSNDDKASFSNYGDWVDIAAPGVDILSLRASGTSMGTVQDEYTTVASGTSMACPHVSGTCALLLSVNPYISPDDAMDILTDPCSVDPVADGICRSDGRLNAYKALLAAVPSAGYISLDKEDYNCDCNVGIALTDCDLKGEGPVDVNIMASGGDWEMVSLTETDSNSGMFTGSISASDGTVDTNDGTLQVSHGETITVTYYDANDGDGNPAEANDTAEVDCVAPTIIGDVKVTVLGQDITVTFETDSNYLGWVLYGADCNETSDSDIDWGTSHSIKLTKLSTWTEYYFKVTATDVAGNEVVDDNDGNCYTFRTEGPNDFNVPGDFNTVQEAIDHSWDGGTVTVAEGTYYETIDFKGRAITVTSTNPDDWDVVEATIIDANGAMWGVTFENHEGPNSVLAGLTVRNAVQSGILFFCEPFDADGTVVNCIIADNGNGGIECYASATIKNNKIYSNPWWGINCDGDKTPTIENNWIWGATSEKSSSGGIVFYGLGGDGIVRNNTIIGNERGILNSEGTAPPISNCIIWDNNDGDLVGCSATYSCIEECNDANGTGNICGDGNDPQFVDDANDDYHLDVNSPCIDAGDPTGDYSGETDIDGEPRVMGDCNEIVDIGADESYFPSCWNCVTQCHGDGNCSGRVDTKDLAAMQKSWLQSYGDPNYNPCADFDKSGTVDETDEAILQDNWFTYPDPNCECGGTWPPE